MQIHERRKQRRLPLRWPIRLTAPPLGTINTKTENLSAQGFFCFLESTLALGSILDCSLTIPNYNPAAAEAMRSILCQAEVVRLEVSGKKSGIGVGCRILDFTLAKA